MPDGDVLTAKWADLRFAGISTSSLQDSRQQQGSYYASTTPLQAALQRRNYCLMWRRNTKRSKVPRSRGCVMHCEEVERNAKADDKKF